MKAKVKYLSFRGLSIFDQLCLEELLLRQTMNNYYLFNTESKSLKTASIVLGLSGNINDLVNIPLAKRDNIELIRRYTGGGTVIVDDDTVFSTFIMNTEHAGCKPYPRDIMTWSETIFHPIFSKFTDKSSPFALRENDYVLGDNKIGGNAQTITKNRWVHHTSFLWKFNTHNMSYLQMPKKRPQYRNDRTHSDFLMNLSTQINSAKEFENLIRHQLNEVYDLEIVNANEYLEYSMKNYLGNKKLLDIVRTKYEDINEY